MKVIDFHLLAIGLLLGMLISTAADHFIKRPQREKEQHSTCEYGFMQGYIKAILNEPSKEGGKVVGFSIEGIKKSCGFYLR